MKPERARRTTSGPAGAAQLVVRFTRVSPAHHRVDLVRGGTTTSYQLETRSTLLHDLVHYALETEVPLRASFYGLLARGVRYEELAQIDIRAADSEIAVTERVAGPLQGAYKRGVDPKSFLAAFSAYEAACGRRAPAWLTEDLIARAVARLRALDGQWRATRFGASMELRFPS